MSDIELHTGIIRLNHLQKDILTFFEFNDYFSGKQGEQWVDPDIQDLGYMCNLDYYVDTYVDRPENLETSLNQIAFALIQSLDNDGFEISVEYKDDIVFVAIAILKN